MGVGGVRCDRAVHGEPVLVVAGLERLGGEGPCAVVTLGHRDGVGGKVAEEVHGLRAGGTEAEGDSEIGRHLGRARGVAAAATRLRAEVGGGGKQGQRDGNDGDTTEQGRRFHGGDGMEFGRGKIETFASVESEHRMTSPNPRGCVHAPRLPSSGRRVSLFVAVGIGPVVPSGQESSPARPYAPPGARPRSLASAKARTRRNSSLSASGCARSLSSACERLRPSRKSRR